jgi:tight adherence protein C
MAALVIVLVAVVAVAAGVLWAERSPRRAALSTLRLAVPKRAPAPAVVGGQRYTGPAPGTACRRLCRLARAALSQTAGLARHLSPPSYLKSLRHRLTLAGWDRQEDADAFLAARLTTAALILPAFVVILVLRVPGLFALLLFGFFAAVLSLGPEAALNRAVASRQQRTRRDLPAMAELLLISVEAGLGLDQAMARAARSLPGPLSEEFSRFLGEVRIGAAHTTALEAIDRRTDVDELRSFLMALSQASVLGISVGPVLRAQSEQVRTAQRQHVQEQAQKAPVKMLFPLVFCVLPALFIVTIGPAVIEIAHTFSHLQK